MSSYIGPTAATFFQAGNTCPFCQEPIAEGQQIIACSDCGSLHHDTCWYHKGACSSYHCDTKVKTEAPPQLPQIVVTSGETEKVTVPPKRAPLGGAAAARAFLVSGPKRISALALISAILAGLALGGLAGVFTGNLWITVSGIVMAIAAMIVAVISLVVVNTSRKVYGYLFAGGAVLLSIGLTTVYFINFGMAYMMQSHTHRVDLGVAQSRPTEEILGRMLPPKAQAMRANVVIKSVPSGVFSMQMVTGSGIVVKMSDRKAWILTNRHVVTGGDDTGTGAGRQLSVLFYNGEESQATVAWLPPEHVDLAILECEALTIDRIEPIEILRTTAAQGDRVFAVGNPEGYYWSYTEGVVSSIRTQHEDGRDLEIYQTQTPINSGNSGGGLYTLDGKLIGINTWTHDKSVAEGLSFAISGRSLLNLLGDDGIKKYLAPSKPDTEPVSPAAPTSTSAATAEPAIW
jgi:S1-C subfamily serine protease